MLTYDWFSVIVDFEGTKPVSDEEREVKYVFNRLCEIIGVYYKAEEVHSTRLLKDFSDL